MAKKHIDTVAELIEKLKEYPGETRVTHHTKHPGGGVLLQALFIQEETSLGDRDSEDKLTLAFASNPKSSY